jgi:hypothetical protein
MAVVVVEALSSELSLVVLSFMFVEHEAPGGSEQVGVTCMVRADVGLQAGAAHSTLITNTHV